MVSRERETKQKAQVSRYAARPTDQRSALRAQPAQAPSHWPTPQSASTEEKRFQKEASTSERPSDERAAEPRTDLRIIRATDGTNLGLQFSAKRMRTVHVDPSTGRVDPRSEWRPVNAKEILRWTQRTAGTTVHSVAGFASIGDALGGDE